MKAARRKSETPESPLEDDDESDGLRRRTHESAKRCLPFLEKFFSAWDAAPKKGSFSEHAAWLHAFAESMGFLREEAEAAAFARLWHELDRWAFRESQMRAGDETQTRAHFLTRLAEIAATVGVETEESKPGCVRAVPADLVPASRYEHLFLLGLGECSFPRLGDLGPLYDSAERNKFVEVGLELRGTEGRLGEEMLLFHRLLGGATTSVTLSYPAIDEKGQRMLPGTFLQNVVDCFKPNTIPTTRRQMLVEGVDTQSSYSTAEYRVRWAAELPSAKDAKAASPVESQVLAAKEMVIGRFRGNQFGAFDGMLGDGAARAEITKQFGPKKKFSATALEDYVACPFRFFMRHVLQLEPVDDPVEDIEAANRGLVIHRAARQIASRNKETGGQCHRKVHPRVGGVDRARDAACLK